LEVIEDGKQSYTARFLRDYLNGGATGSTGIDSRAEATA